MVVMVVMVVVMVKVMVMGGRPHGDGGHGGDMW